MRQNIGIRFAFALSVPSEVFSSVIRVANSKSVIVPTLTGPPLKRAYSLRLCVDIWPLQTLLRDRPLQVKQLVGRWHAKHLIFPPCLVYNADPRRTEAFNRRPSLPGD
jgi:hypothetical protein